MGCKPRRSGVLKYDKQHAAGSASLGLLDPAYGCPPAVDAVRSVNVSETHYRTLKTPCCESALFPI